MFWILQLSQEEEERARQFQRDQQESRLAKTGRAAGTAVRAGGAGMRATGAGMQAAGKGMKAAGKGMQAGGRAMTQAGTSLSSTGVGAIAGVPLTVAGAGTTAAGAGVQAAGAGVETGGKAIGAAGRGATTLGKQIQKSAAVTEAMTAPPGDDVMKRIIELVGRMPLMSLIKDNFPVLFWLVGYIIRSFSFILIIVALLSLPVLWGMIAWLAWIGNKIKLPLMPFRLPNPPIWEMVISGLLTTFVILSLIVGPVMLALTVICQNTWIKITLTLNKFLSKIGLNFIPNIDIDCGEI